MLLLAEYASLLAPKMEQLNQVQQGPKPLFIQ